MNEITSEISEMKDYILFLAIFFMFHSCVLTHYSGRHYNAWYRSLNKWHHKLRRNVYTPITRVECTYISEKEQISCNK